MRIQQHKLDERILAVYSGTEIYVGHGKKLLNFTRNEILYNHEKSIRSISGNNKYVGSASYDGTAAVFTKESNKLVDRIEGPDTEIKSIVFWNDFIAIATRGKTVWILENLEISKILEEHTQDVKGCCFH